MVKLGAGYSRWDAAQAFISHLAEDARVLMVKPLWITASRAMRRFNWCASLPKVSLSSLLVMTGWRVVGDSDKLTTLTCSISEDYARLWLYFARRVLHPDRWQCLIVDSSGDMDVRKLEGASLVRFVNWPHGRKCDLIMRHVIGSEVIFICDDDKYILADPTSHQEVCLGLQTPEVAAISFSPRRWWRFRLKGQEYLPMGSYAVMVKKSVLARHRLTLESPRGLRATCKVFAEGAKEQWSYDTADYANEQLLSLGYQVHTLQDNPLIAGFDGLSLPRVVLRRYGKAYVKGALLEASDFRLGTINGGMMRGVYGIVKVERLYRQIFSERPGFVSGFSEEEVREIPLKNPNLTEEQRESMDQYFADLEGIYTRLSTRAGSM